MITLVFFLEELSAKALLEILLPRFIPEDKFVLRFVPFEGKQDLDKQLVRRIRGWRTPNHHRGSVGNFLKEKILQSSDLSLAGLQSGRAFVIPNKQEQATAASDFELITWIVIKSGRTDG